MWWLLLGWVDVGDWCHHWPRCRNIEACDALTGGPDVPPCIGCGVPLPPDSECPTACNEDCLEAAYERAGNRVEAAALATVEEVTPDGPCHCGAYHTGCAHGFGADHCGQCHRLPDLDEAEVPDAA